ncbi:MAG TPA: DUF6644 family protein [Casimicrobiaceae bacterium]|nr:DUF6644 family protein [Casimicrobiaceae bacterium]
MASALHAVEATGVARFMREALYAYPVTETVHITGLALLFGSIAIVDLRLLGLGKRIPLSALVAFAVPWSIVGFIVAAGAGSLMLVAHANEFLTLPLFWIKMTLIVLAGSNALLLHRGALRNAAALDAMTVTPPRLRVAAALSLVLWLGVIACGRFLAYL